MNMLAIVISLACAGFVLLRELLFKHSGQRCRKNHKQAPPVARLPLGASPKPEILVPKSYRCGLERTGADIETEAFYPVVYCGRIDYSGNCANRKTSIGSDGYPNL